MSASRRVLIVEDETIVAMLIEDMAAELGYEVAGLASRADTALELARDLRIDCAILDMNLNGQDSYSIAEMLNARGVPFVFATGYSTAELPAALRNVPILQKPFESRDLERALLAAARSRSQQA